MLAGMAVGTIVTAAAMKSATAPAPESGKPAACTMTKVQIEAETYYRCTPNWYQKAFTNGEMTYVVVNAPPGM